MRAWTSWIAAGTAAQADIWRLFGTRARASEVLSGKRGISKAHAKKLAAFFRVPADLFI